MVLSTDFFSHSKGLTRLKCFTNCMLILLFSLTSCGHTEEKKLCSVAIDCPNRWIFNQQKTNCKTDTQKNILYRILCAFQNKGACYWHATVFGLKSDEFYFCHLFLVDKHASDKDFGDGGGGGSRRILFNGYHKTIKNKSLSTISSYTDWYKDERGKMNFENGILFKRMNLACYGSLFSN